MNSFFRVVKMGIKYYAYEVSIVYDDADNIQEFIESGDVVLLGETLEDIASVLNVDVDEIEVVK